MFLTHCHGTYLRATLSVSETRMSAVNTHIVCLCVRAPILVRREQEYLYVTYVYECFERCTIRVCTCEYLRICKVY